MIIRVHESNPFRPLLTHDIAVNAPLLTLTNIFNNRHISCSVFTFVNHILLIAGNNQTQLLLHRITKSQSLDSGADWVYGDDGKLEYDYRLVCGNSYYGKDCDIICKPRHDNFGHYTCGPDGEKICLEGWEKDNQNSARDDYCLKRKYTQLSSLSI